MNYNIPPGEILGHPKGLFLLFTTEMWERFSYYGMRALLVLTLVAGTEAANPGFGWSQGDALKLYGWYTGLVYFTPLIGGWLADNFIGQRRSIIIGGVLMALAQFVLAASIPGNTTLFFIGLVLLIIGNGFFKPNISTMVGDLYGEHDTRRDGAFTIFYMGINVGAFLAPLICSTLGEDPAYGWKYGYIAAGVGMSLSVIIQLALANRFLGDVGVKPSAKLSLEMSGGEKKPLTAEERDRLRVIFTLFIFVVLFWASFEQAGGLMNLYANDKTDRMIDFMNFEVPAGWFQSLNPFYIVILAPVFSMMWIKMGSKNPATPFKMVIGLMLTAIGFFFMVAAVYDQQANGLASMWWLALAYLFHTMGELCISPVGLSMTTKLAPLRLASLMMGVWFLINFFANLLAGYIGAFAETMGEMAIFAGIAIANIIFALILWPISGKLVDWMHGAETYGEDVKHEVKEELEATSDHA
ncbi:peptide MFS transporter [Aliikangiella marina]|uniref:Peptide MFS transporter n=1 Tax=Aliikangiella marina TaxID=1712262 RepID=A0A545T2Z3_9GAMM|nr:peptide MFS transporter [Aliikangiella marina]TQV71568.1 peptide MFS transporter [Aliikangiella marina]